MGLAKSTSRNPSLSFLWHLLNLSQKIHVKHLPALFPTRGPSNPSGHKCHALVDTHLQSQLLYLKLLHGAAVPFHIFMVVDHHHVILFHDGLVILGAEVVDAVFAIILRNFQALLPPGQGPQ